MYDYIIVGAGPAGLALAQYCSFAKKRVLLIERENEIGGLHRVRRVNGYFSEHGPRIYSSAYMVFRMLLHKMGTDFFELFTPYQFQMLNIGGQSASHLSVNAVMSFIVAFIATIVFPRFGKNTTMEEWMDWWKFSDANREYINRVCVLTDGASVKRYTLFKFLSIVNQQFYHKIYQPKMPNDVGFLKIWKQHLVNTSLVDFKLNTDIQEIEVRERMVYAVRDTRNNVYQGHRYVFAIPPTALVPLFWRTKLLSPQFANFASQTRYSTYIPICFHWTLPVEIPKVWGFPKSEWGVAFVVLTEYMTFETSHVVISTAITLPDAQSSVLGKSANEANESEMIMETFRQLRLSFPDLPIFDRAIVSPGVFKTDGKWDDIDTAFVDTEDITPLPFQPVDVDNLYTLGTQNGYSVYNFTSLESAVYNAIVLGHELHPEGRPEFPLESATELTFIIRVILLGIIGYVVYHRFLV